MLHARHSYVGDLQGAKIKAIGREFIKRTRAASADEKKEEGEKKKLTIGEYVSRIREVAGFVR